MATTTRAKKKIANHKGVAQRRDFEALERRRLRAADMFRRGKRQVDVVNELGVTAETASEWYRLWSQGGKQALHGAGRAGRLPKITDEDLAEVEWHLLQGPGANGFDTDVWTLARIGDVIEEVTGVRYSITQTWEIMRKRLGWSRQRPARRAVERDEASIENWVKVEWPRIKKVPGAGGPGSSSKTSRASLSSPR